MDQGLHGRLDDALAGKVPLPDIRLRRLARLAAGLTQEDLAQVLGVARATVARWELGTRQPRGALRRSYAEALDRLYRLQRREAEDGL